MADTFKMSEEVLALLGEDAELFRQRNGQYKDNYVLVGKIMAILFPEGVELESAEDHEFWHLFELVIVKLTRFATSDCTHADSVKDARVYLAMVEALTRRNKA